MIRFRYKPETTRNREIIWRPVADVWFLSEKKGWIELHPYIDSGADITLVPFSFGRLLGFMKSNRIEKIGGISGSIGVVYQQCKIKIGSQSFNIRVGWAQIEAVPALLGREGVFDKFNILFRENKKEIIFSERA